MPKRLTPIKSIREFYKQCVCGDIDAIRDCKPVPSIEDCPLWPYRMGKNPNVTDETREMFREKLKQRGGIVGKTDSKTSSSHKL